MVLFWTLAALMAALAVAFVVAPLLRARVGSAPTTAEANLEVLRAQRRELEADVESGTLAPAAREAALAELQLRASQDVQGDDRPVAASRKPWALAVAMAVAVPVLAFGLYGWLGQPRAADPAVMAMMKGAGDARQVTELVETLARKVRERPDDVRGWTLLARSMAALGRFQESADAYAHLVSLQPRDATLLLTLAQLCARQGLWGKAQSYVEASIAVDPTYAAHLEAAQLYERAGNADAANRHYRESLALAVARIRDTEEARRRLYSLRASAQATPAN